MTFPSGGGSGVVTLAPNQEIIAKPWTYDAGVVGEVVIGAKTPDLASGVPPAALVALSGVQVYGGGAGAVLPTQTTVFEVRNWKLVAPPALPSPPNTISAALSGGPDTVTTLVFEGSNEVAGQQWVPIVARDAYTGEPLQSIDVPPYATAHFSRFIHVPSYSYSLVRMRAKTYRTAAWVTVSGTGVGGISPPQVPNQVGDQTLRATTIVNAPAAFANGGAAYTINSTKASWSYRTGTFTGAQVTAQLSYDGTNWSTVQSVPWDGTGAAITPAIANSSAGRGFWVRADTAKIMRLIMNLSTGTLVLDVAAMPGT